MVMMVMIVNVLIIIMIKVMMMMCWGGDKERLIWKSFIQSVAELKQISLTDYI